MMARSRTRRYKPTVLYIHIHTEYIGRIVRKGGCSRPNSMGGLLVMVGGKLRTSDPAQIQYASQKAW